MATPPLQMMPRPGLRKSQEKKPYEKQLKRRRPTIDDEEDTENILPPSKQPRETYSSNNNMSSVDSGLQRNSSPLLLSDDACSSILDNGDSCSEASSPQYVAKVLSPLNNLDNVRPRGSRRSSSGNQERACPLPKLSFANCCDVWKRMCERDAQSVENRSANMLKNHLGLKLRMRAILLDWINEVCCAFKLHRETFHLCCDYVDRYLTCTKKRRHKSDLQKIGVTCLFIAAKMEEIYPPKVVEFADVTDGACSVEDIFNEELEVLSALDWKLSPMTANNWLNVYLQLYDQHNRKASQPANCSSGEGLRNYALFFTQYSSLDFMMCARLIDFALLHIDVNKFKYSELAAAAMAHTFDKEKVKEALGYTSEELRPCYRWLKTFVKVLSEFEYLESGVENNLVLPDCGNTYVGGGLSHACPNINPDASHRVQVHNIPLEYFDRVEEYMQEIEADDEAICPDEEPENSNKVQ